MKNGNRQVNLSKMQRVIQTKLTNKATSKGIQVHTHYTQDAQYVKFRYFHQLSIEELKFQLIVHVLQ